MKRDITTYADRKGQHSYDVYTKDTIFHVIATNRDQAARIVERDGRAVGSVNMTG